MAEPVKFYPLFGILKAVLFPIIGLVTELIKDELGKFIKSLYKKALATENVWDDFLVERLAFLLSVDISGVE